MPYDEVFSKLDLIGAYTIEYEFPEEIDPELNADEIPDLWLRIDFVNPDISKEIGVWHLHFNSGILESAGCMYRCYFD